jgi:flagellin
MTISINTNLAANNATVYLQANQAELDKSLTRLSSGSKVDQVTEDAEVQRLSAIVKRFKSAKVNLANAMSFTQTQSGYLKGIADALERMGELAMISNDETKSNDDRIAYNQEYKSLFEFIDESRKKAFNGRDLYNGESMKVSAGSDVADQFTLNGINLQHTTTNADGDWEPQNSDADGGGAMDDTTNKYSFYAILRPELDGDGNATGEAHFNISSLDGARNVLQYVEKALLAVSGERASVGALQGSIEGRTQMIDVAIDNYDSTRSRVQDVDVAEESTRLAKYNILVQSSTAILAQANQLPQNILRLLN